MALSEVMAKGVLEAKQEAEEEQQERAKTANDDDDAKEGAGFK